MNTNRLINSTILNNLAVRLTGPTGLTRALPENARHQASSVHWPSRSELTHSLQADALRKTDNWVRRILVPLDGTTFAEHAIPLALAIAEQSDAVVQLVHVLVPAEVAGPFEVLHSLDFTLKDYKNRKCRYLADISRQITATAPVCVTSSVIQGMGVGEALHHTFASTADLVVMATHGRGAVGRFWWGSAAYSLLKRMTAPLILVPGNNEQPDFTPQAVDHVVLPIDGDKSSNSAVEPLLDLGLFATARHTLLHATRPEPKLVVRGNALRTEWKPSHSREVAGIERLRPLANTLSESGRQVQTKI